MKVLSSLSILFSALAISACSTYPMGLSESEWNALTPEQRQQAVQQQAELDDKYRIAQQEAEIREQEERAQQKADSNPGEWLQCTLTENRIYRGFEWKQAQDDAFEILAGDKLQLNIEKDDFVDVSLNVTFDGQIIELCHFNKCDRVTGTSKQYQAGIDKQIVLEKTYQGVLHCDAVKRQPMVYKVL
ncbi:hypothetical protein [uncultured Thalassolituus sp.]|uniref:hypothetical protein n=1 Tax=uncultured Thalassolituus sp. TaxID=285273 RepID=UPI00262BAF62|nr:hypothetical protein [uncultured Thalassolituus sp.]